MGKHHHSIVSVSGGKFGCAMAEASPAWIDTPIDIEALLTLNTVIPQVLPALQTFAENMMRDLHGDHDVELDLPCTMP